MQWVLGATPLKKIPGGVEFQLTALHVVTLGQLVEVFRSGGFSPVEFEVAIPKDS